MDYDKPLIAFSSNSTNIAIAIFDGTLVDEITLPSGQIVVSLAFTKITSCW
jgi:hypothetical protein